MFVTPNSVFWSPLRAPEPPKTHAKVEKGMILTILTGPPPPKTLQNGPSIFRWKVKKQDCGTKTIFLAKERANGSPKAVQKLF